MTLEATRSLYERTLTDSLVVRRYGGAGADRPHQDYPVRGRIVGDRPAALVGSANQYDYTCIVFYNDLIATGFPLPITTNDKIVYRERELAVMFPDPATRSVDGVTVGLVLKVRG